MRRATLLILIQLFTLPTFLFLKENACCHPILSNIFLSNDYQNPETFFYQEIFSKAEDLSLEDKNFLYTTNQQIPDNTRTPTNQYLTAIPFPFFLVPKTSEYESFYATLQKSISCCPFDFGFIWLNTHPTLLKQIEIAKNSIHYDYSRIINNQITIANYNPWNISFHKPPLLRNFQSKDYKLENPIQNQRPSINEYDNFRIQNSDIWDIPGQSSIKQEILDHILALYEKIYKDLPDQMRPDINIKNLFSDAQTAYSYSPTLLVRGDDLNSINFLGLHNRFRSARKTMYGPGVYFATSFDEADKYATNYKNQAALWNQQNLETINEVNSALYCTENRKALPTDNLLQMSYITESNTEAKWFIISLVLMGTTAQYHFYNIDAKSCDTSLSGASSRIIKLREKTYIATNKFNSIPLAVINYRNKKKQN